MRNDYSAAIITVATIILAGFLLYLAKDLETQEDILLKKHYYETKMIRLDLKEWMDRQGEE